MNDITLRQARGAVSAAIEKSNEIGVKMPLCALIDEHTVLVFEIVGVAPINLDPLRGFLPLRFWPLLEALAGSGEDRHPGIVFVMLTY